MTNTISRMFGKFASKEFPDFFQRIINYGYVRILGLNMDEFKTPKEYKTLNALFTRKLEKKRHFDISTQKFISPADSFITSQGDVINTMALQIKGMSYSINELLTDYVNNEAKSKIANGSYMNFYLSPKDYHRYHASFDCKVNKAIYVAGKLLPVNIPYLKKEKNLFVKNERVILECEYDGKLFYMIFVGALNVGQMVINFEPSIETNKDANIVNCYEYENLYIKKGDEIGYFKMGSTVVMIWEENFVKLKNLENQKVRFGSIIADKI